MQVELCQLADAGTGGFFTERGYRLESFENVLGRRLGDTDVPDGRPAQP